MTAQTTEPEGPRPARRDRAPEEGAQRGHPRPLLPEAGNPGPRRFRRRQPRSVAQGGGDRRRGDRLLRRPLHGRDREDPVARKRSSILPDMDAGCSLEDSCPPDQFKAFREAHPDHIALTYINCSAAVKALSDIIVTSLVGRHHPQADSRRSRRSSSAPTGTSAAISRGRPAATCCCGRASASSTRRSAKPSC